MTDDPVNNPSPEEEIHRALNSGKGPKYARFALACISGAIPIIGGVLAAVGGSWSEAEQDKVNRLFQNWLKMQADELAEIGKTVDEIVQRVDLNEPTNESRMNSPEYMSLIKKAFRDWSAAESEERRILVRNLLATAACTRICSDDVVKLFIEWIGRYTDGHFSVIRFIFNNPNSTRSDVWSEVKGDTVREDSADADLFKLYFHDLTVGRVIRQRRDTDGAGNFLRQQRRSAKSASRTMVSAFDDDKEYVLTQLGQWFVSYAMNEMVPRLDRK